MNIIASVKVLFKESKNYYNFLEINEKKWFRILFILLIFNSFLEIIGLASLIPLVDIIINFENSKVIDYISSSQYFSSFSESKMKILILSSFLILFGLKIFYSVLLNFLQNSFVASLGNRISQTILKNLIQKKYDYYQNKNSSFFVKLFQTEINTFNNYSQALLIFLTELAIVSLIAISLTIFNPYTSLILLIILLASFLIYNLITKSRVSNWGKLRNENDQMLYKFINDFFTGIKEIKLNDSVSFLKFNLYKKFQIKSRLHRNFSTLNSVPRFYYEFFLVLSIITFFLVSILVNMNFKTIAVLSTIFIASSLKIIPSMNRITSSLQTLKFSVPAISILSKYINEKTTVNYEKIEFLDSIFLKNISMNFSSNFLIRNQSLRIKKGEKILITGESGSGKTTLADIIALLKAPSNGDIYINDLKTNTKSIITNLRYVTQNPFFMDDSIINNIHMNIKTKPNKELILKLIKMFGLESLIKEYGLESQIGEKAQNISGGQKQRLALVRALYDNPSILILDEFTSGLDIDTENKVLDVLFKNYNSITIIAISHQLRQKKYFDKEIKILNETLVEHKLN